MNCGLVRRHLDAYVDGEVDPTTQIEFERHLAACAGCQELLAFTRQVKVEVWRSCRAVRAPAALRDRIRLALREADRRALADPRPLLLRKRITVPLATAAAVLMGLTWGIGMDGERAPNARASAMPIFEDVVRVHSSELPADVQAERAEQVQRWFQNKVTFPVRPAEFERRDARLVGARLSNVRERRAAALYYTVGGRRMTVVVFDGVQANNPLEQGALRTRLLGRELYYQQVHGYTVPLRRQDGLTYAFTADMDRQTVLRLAASARVRY